MPLLADEALWLATIIFGLAWMGFVVDHHPLGRRVSGVVFVLVSSMILSNTGILPITAPLYDFVGQYLVPLAIPLLLLHGDLRRIFRESGRVMYAFAIATMATIIAAYLGFFLFDLGEAGPRVAGLYAAGWIGGAVNHIAVSQAVSMTPSEFSIAISASSVVSILALLTLMVLPTSSLVRRYLGSEAEIPNSPNQMLATQSLPPPTFEPRMILAALTIALGICALANTIAALANLKQYTILLISLVTIVVANAVPKRLEQIRGNFEIGMIFMYLFFAIIGAGTDALLFLGSAVILLFYGLFIIVVHLVLVLLVSRVLGISLSEAITGSAAALVGPTATAAVASTLGWREMITPGIMCGVFGYLIATFIGITITGSLS